MIMHHFAPFSQLRSPQERCLNNDDHFSAVIRAGPAKPFLNERIYKDTEAEKTSGHEWFRMKRG
jgi:hypothetical protein